mmetsp:Transcript_66894/g.168932  ORF Transcript_66894/g.168932 Transcript_66894/m.168932 type:complete len:223 (-) Transcript_66894:490-1158(-)
MASARSKSAASMSKLPAKSPVWDSASPAETWDSAYAAAVSTHQACNLCMTSRFKTAQREDSSSSSMLCAPGSTRRRMFRRSASTLACASWILKVSNAFHIAFMPSLLNASLNRSSSASGKITSKVQSSVFMAFQNSKMHHIRPMYRGLSQGSSRASTCMVACTRVSKISSNTSKGSLSPFAFFSSTRYWLQHTAHCQTKVCSGSRPVRSHQRDNELTTVRTL